MLSGSEILTKRGLAEDRSDEEHEASMSWKSLKRINLAVTTHAIDGALDF
jgi:hypothetical protein